MLVSPTLPLHMADECIVCLGSLIENTKDLAIPAIDPVAQSPLDHGKGHTLTDRDDNINDSTGTDKLIAFLPSCGHYLHNECLKSWIERANSCPICRKTFNTVDLWTRLGGPAISTYAVEDRVQEAIIDPEILADEEYDEEDDEDQVCQVCDEDDNEDVLMYCDSCSKLYHTYCVGLQEVPIGAWFCDACREVRDNAPPTSVTRTNRRPRGYNRRTRGQQRRYRQQDLAHEQSYHRVWRSVWDSINLDLDFPFDEEDAAAAYARRARQRNDNDRRQYQAWQRRAHIAELQGGPNRFRDITQPAPEEPLLHTSSLARRPRPGTPPQESMDELRAWHAFDRAREIEAAGGSDSVATRTRKRKSATASPAEPEPAQPGRRVKRPRMRRQIEVAEASDLAESSNNRRTSPSQQTRTDQNPSPSFLQSLLKEVQGSPAPNHGSGTVISGGNTTSAEHASPTPSSPILSPVPSNHSSPRASSITPPPLHHIRPSSPTGLSSSIQPIFPHIENAPSPPQSDSNPSPTFAADREHANGNPSNIHQLYNFGHASSLSDSEQPLGSRRIPRSALGHSPAGHRSSRSNDNSPVRVSAHHQPKFNAFPHHINHTTQGSGPLVLGQQLYPGPKLSFESKQDIQKMVSSALKPFYNDNVITKEDYTRINRDVSRMMYEKVGDEFEGLEKSEREKKWLNVAAEEVGKVVKGVEELKVVEDSDEKGKDETKITAESVDEAVKGVNGSDKISDLQQDIPPDISIPVSVEHQAAPSASVKA